MASSTKESYVSTRSHVKGQELIQDIREGFPEEVMILGLDFKEESEDRWYPEKRWGRGKTRDPGQLSFPGSLLPGFVIGGSMYS